MSGDRLGRWLLFAVGWFAAAYFTPREPGWNVNTRLALTYAIVDEHRLTIDSFHDRPGYDTGDKAFIDGHFYSDKVIGNALAGVVPYQIARWMGPSLTPAGKRWVATAFTVSLCFGLLLVVLSGLMERQGVTPRHATFLAALGGFGTMLYPYAGLFMPYVPACLFALLAYRLTLARESGDDLRAIPIHRFALAGLCMGLAVLFEFLAGLIGLCLAAHVIGSQGFNRRGLAALMLFGVGGVIGVAPYLLYSWTIFGSLTIPYQYEHSEFFRAAMASGFAGIHFPPDPSIFLLVTFHPFRGLFVYAPMLLLGIAGWFAMRRLPHGRQRGLLCAGIAGGYLLINAGYLHQWWGGWTCGPRLLILSIPFYLLGVAALWARWPPIRAVVTVLGTIGVAYHVAALAIDPQPPTPVPEPISANEYLMRADLAQWYPIPLWVWNQRSWLSGQESLTMLTPLGVPAPWSWALPVLAAGVALALWRRRGVHELEQSPSPVPGSEP